MEYTRNQIIAMLSLQGDAMKELFDQASEVKRCVVGDKIYTRGLIEYSNVCRKNCLYCGIRCDNRAVVRYTLSREQVMDAVDVAIEKQLGSVVLQAGENQSQQHVEAIEALIRDIKQRSEGTLGITLSLGEQSRETLQSWFAAGAHRYLLRIESSSPELYARIHPADHSYNQRVEMLKVLRETGYQLGTGVMIGLPWQSVDNLADDICFMRNMNIDMCGMGPYIESDSTPLTMNGAEIPSRRWRLEMSLKMVAVLRIVMPDINIASTTALSSLSPDGRFLAVKYGANIIMPNITPCALRENYNLYNDKSAEIDTRLLKFISCGEWGDSLHFRK